MEKLIILTMKLLAINTVAALGFLVALFALGYDMNPISAIGMGLTSAFIAGSGLTSGAIVAVFAVFSERKRRLYDQTNAEVSD